MPGALCLDHSPCKGSEGLCPRAPAHRVFRSLRPEPLWSRKARALGLRVGLARFLIRRHKTPLCFSPAPENQANNINPEEFAGDCFWQTPAHQTVAVWLRGWAPPSQSFIYGPPPARLSQSGGFIHLRQAYGGFRLRPW